MKPKAVFLDKDGTILEDVPYNVDPERVRPVEGAIEGLRRLSALGYRLIVVTNQPGIGLGRFGRGALVRLERHVRELLGEAGVSLAGFYACPHRPDEGCDCRKPRSGLLIQAARECGIDINSSWMIGDILDDVEAGHGAGCRSVLINSGNETEWRLDSPRRRPEILAATIDIAARHIERSGAAPLPDRICFDERFAAWQDARKVLCVRLDAIGDVMMTSPALHALKVSRAGRRLTLLTSTAGAEAARLLPVDDVIVYEAPWMKASFPAGGAARDRAVIEELRSRAFDAAVIFTVYSQSALPAATLCRLAEIPLRLAHCRENPYSLLTDWRRETEPEGGVRHEVHRQLDLAASIGATTWDERLKANIPSAVRARVDGWLVRRGIVLGEPLVAIHPGASASSRRYRPDAFAEAARRLWRARRCTIIFTGSASERPLVEAIRKTAGVPSLSCAGVFDLAETAALLGRADLLISNNTGAVHLAAASGTPVVDLYALTNPQHTPWMTPNRVLFHDVPCRNCYRSVCPEEHHACLELVEPEAVCAAALELLGDGAAASAGDVAAGSNGANGGGPPREPARAAG